MERVSNNLLAAALLATLFMLSTSTQANPVLGRMPSSRSSNSNENSKKFYLIEEMEVAKPKDNPEQNYGGQKTMMMSKNRYIQHQNRVFDVENMQEVATKMAESKLSCVSQGQYCNIFFGPYCCSTAAACVPLGIAGGVCVA